MNKNTFSLGEKNAATTDSKIITLKQSASSLTKGGSGHIPEYFVVAGIPVTFYA